MVKLAEAEYLENPHEVSPTTSDFRGHSLAFRVTLPVEIEKRTAFLLHRVMNLGCHGLADYLVRGWQHLPEVSRTGFFSASNVTILRLQACRQASPFAAHRERIRGKRELEREPETRIIRHGLDVGVPTIRGFMRQPLMTAGVGLARGCNPWASVVFFGAYLCSDQLHASQGWTCESNQIEYPLCPS